MRIARLALVTAAAAAFVLPVGAAQAGRCVDMTHTPVECTLEKVGQAISVGPVANCVYYGTFELICLPSAT